MSKSEEIRREILELESRYDGLPESAVTERRELERRVNELREQLGEPEVPSEPAPKRDLVREAREHIGTVEDVLGTKSPEQERAEKVAALEAARAKERYELERSLRHPNFMDPPTTSATDFGESEPSRVRSPNKIRRRPRSTS